GENYVGFDASTFNSSVVFTYNYAFGGATINGSLVAPYEPTVLSFIDQVKEFLTGGLLRARISPGTVAPQFSHFPLRASLTLLRFADTLLDEYFALMQNLVLSQLDRSAVGARNFLFFNVPRVDLTPLIVAEGATAQAQLESVIDDFNTRLASPVGVGPVQENSTGVMTWLWDFNSVFTMILSAPTKFGFVDAVGYGNTGDLWG
ncbi:hypothetical protein DFH07DRAFT_761806, partial [Mycena maculata]